MLQTKGTVSLLEQTDWLLPVPMAPADLGHRGFNQSWLLCQALCRQIPHCTLRNTPLRTEPDALVKRVQTPSQHLLGRQERQKNLQHAFAVSPQARHRLSGLRVTLVDDILTTGATFEALARVLRQAGVAQVNGWALARTPAGDKEAAEAALC
jgi:ComF family protein